MQNIGRKKTTFFLPIFGLFFLFFGLFYPPIFWVSGFFCSVEMAKVFAKKASKILRAWVVVTMCMVP